MKRSTAVFLSTICLSMNLPSYVQAADSSKSDSTTKTTKDISTDPNIDKGNHDKGRTEATATKDFYVGDDGSKRNDPGKKKTPSRHQDDVDVGRGDDQRAVSLSPDVKKSSGGEDEAAKSRIPTVPALNRNDDRLTNPGKSNQ